MRLRRLFLGLPVAAVSVLTALVFAGTAGATTVTVTCPSGDLQGALNTAAPGETIVINGICFGNFILNASSVTLQGGSPGATLNGRGNGHTLVITDSPNTTIRNLTITNGRVSGDGGGLWVTVSELELVNSVVSWNRADFGGGIYADSSQLDLTGVTVTRNAASYQGGGIVAFNSDLSMTASTVSLNKSTQIAEKYGGGGIWMTDSNVVLTSTRVTTNTSADYGGGIADYGGRLVKCSPPVGQVPVCLGSAGVAAGRSSDGLPAGLTLVNSSVDHNTAAEDGGGIYNESNDGDSPVTLQGTTASFNNALDGDGGGIANYGECGNTASVLATKSTFQGNLAKAGDGGAVYNATGPVCQSGGTALVTIAQSPVANGPSVVNSNQAQRGGGFANEQDEDGVASLMLQPGARVSGNKASVTGGGVWNSCGRFSSLAQIMLNTPNNVVSNCI